MRWILLVCLLTFKPSSFLVFVQNPDLYIVFWFEYILDLWSIEETGGFAVWSAGAGRYFWMKKKHWGKRTAHLLQWNQLVLLLLLLLLLKALLQLLLPVTAEAQGTERVVLHTDESLDVTGLLFPLLPLLLCVMTLLYPADLLQLGSTGGYLTI